jgi:hypothetical protein
MPFFLAAIEVFLFFLGRSIVLSVTSMTTISIEEFDSCRHFFPGRANTLARLKIFSIFRIMRQAVDSVTPQD